MLHKYFDFQTKSMTSSHQKDTLFIHSSDALLAFYSLGSGRSDTSHRSILTGIFTLSLFLINTSFRDWDQIFNFRLKSKAEGGTSVYERFYWRRREAIEKQIL